MSGRHIAVVNFTRMGDLIQSGPFMRSLRGVDDRLTLMVYEGFREAAERLPMVDDVVALDLDGLLTHLNGERTELSRALPMLREFVDGATSKTVDELWNLSHTPLSATLCGLVTAARKFGLLRQADGQLTVHGDWFFYLLSLMEGRADNPYNLVEVFVRLGVHQKRVLPLEFEVSDEDRARARDLLAGRNVRRDEPYIALQPGASSPSRQWPASSFAELARLFAEAGLKVVIVGSAGEAKLATGIVRWSRDAAVSLCGDTDVPTLAAILQGAQRLISNDTGTIHLAAAVGTPTVGIYVGPASAKDTAPYGEGHLVTEPDLECAPCGYHDLCMRPACQSVIRPADIFALAAAKREDVARVASAMAGARVYLTHLSSSAGYSIELLNAPHHPSAVGRLQFYRRLWDDLLSPSDGGRAVRADGHREDSTERRQAAGALEAIAREAEQALAESRSAGRAVTSSLPASRILERQLPWQRKLQAFARSDDLLAPLARVALIRTRYARLRATEEFCQDMQAAVNLLSRGARLAYLRRVHAGAEASEYV